MKNHLNYSFLVCTLFLLISPILAQSSKCICNVEFAPVCAYGSKGKNHTFSSACEANCANYTVAHNGSCISHKVDNQSHSNESHEGKSPANESDPHSNKNHKGNKSEQYCNESDEPHSNESEDVANKITKTTSNKEEENHENENIYNGTYLAQKQISSGYFGVVYFGVDLKTNESVAIKVEKNGKSVLKEASILSLLHDLKGVPKLFWAGTQNKIDVMVISLLGNDLISYLKNFKKFSLKTVVMLADQLLNILETIHSKGVVHGDLKPGNILMGVGDKHDQCFIVDFGISKVYRYSNGTHIPYRTKKPFIGTRIYASISVHNGIETSRKDDLESLIYVLVFLHKGNLPWQKLNMSESENKKKVGEMKMKLASEEICKDMPEEFVKFLNYVKNLSFKQNPDYSYLKGLIGKAALANNFQMDNKWDWIMPDVKDKTKSIDFIDEEATKVHKGKNIVPTTDSHPNKIGGLNTNGFDSFLNISSQIKSDLNYKIAKMSSSSNLNFEDVSSDLLKVPDFLDKSGDNSQNSSFFNQCLNTSTLGLDDRKTEGLY